MAHLKESSAAVDDSVVITTNMNIQNGGEGIDRPGAALSSSYDTMRSRESCEVDARFLGGHPTV